MDADVGTPPATSGGRMKDVKIVKGIVYGNVARYFGKKREEDNHTHQWTVYVKPYRNEDMSTYVKKVHFKLHDSYSNANRIVTKPPFEVTETGWGEFEVVIKIHFSDSVEKPVTLYHALKLFSVDADINAGKKQLVNETYDEIIFAEPTVMMYDALTMAKTFSNGSYKHNSDIEERKQKQLEQIRSARERVRSEISELEERVKKARDSITHLKTELEAIDRADGVATELG